MARYTLASGRVLEVPDPPVPSKRMTKRAHARPDYGWEKDALGLSNHDALSAPGRRFWYDAVSRPDRRGGDPSPTGCIIVPDEVGWKPNGEPNRL